MASPICVSNGCIMQQVYKAQTQSGVYGWFTNGFLVWSLTPDEYSKPDSWHSDTATSRGFLYVSR